MISCKIILAQNPSAPLSCDNLCITLIKKLYHSGKRLRIQPWSNIYTHWDLKKGVSHYIYIIFIIINFSI